MVLSTDVVDERYGTVLLCLEKRFLDDWIGSRDGWGGERWCLGVWVEGWVC